MSDFEYGVVVDAKQVSLIISETALGPTICKIYRDSSDQAGQIKWHHLCENMVYKNQTAYGIFTVEVNV